MQVRAAGGVWRDVGRLPEAALAQQIRQDEIDILVELTGTGVVVGQQMAHTHAYMTIGTQKSVACCCCGTHVALGGEVEAAWSRTWSQACVYLHAPAALHALSLHVYAFSAACCLPCTTSTSSSTIRSHCQQPPGRVCHARGTGASDVDRLPQQHRAVGSGLSHHRLCVRSRGH